MRLFQKNIYYDQYKAFKLFSKSYRHINIFFILHIALLTQVLYKKFFESSI